MRVRVDLRGHSDRPPSNRLREYGTAPWRLTVMLPSSHIEPAAQAGVVRIRPAEPMATRQGVPAFAGVSARTAGATGICMNLIELAPGAAARPHAHVGFETAIHMLEGTIELWHGDDLEHRLVLRAGDFVFIAPGVMHQPRNASMTGTVRAVVARNTPAEQESVVLRGEPALVAIG
jgi:uncharacterized RmlC-like cupin family protein